MAEEKSTAVSRVCEKGVVVHLFEWLEEVKASGGHINDQDENGWSVTHWASYYDRLEFLEFLVERKADILLRDKKARTPLHVACERSSKECAKYLIQQGAPTTWTDNNDKKPTDLADAETLEAVKVADVEGAKKLGHVHYQHHHTVSRQSSLRVHTGEVMRKAMLAAKQRNFSLAEELMAEALASSNPKDNPLSEADAARQGLARYFRPFEATMVGWKPYEEAVRNVSVRFLSREILVEHVKHGILSDKVKEKKFAWSTDMIVKAKSDTTLVIDLLGTHDVLLTIESGPATKDLLEVLTAAIESCRGLERRASALGRVESV